MMRKASRSQQAAIYLRFVAALVLISTALSFLMLSVAAPPPRSTAAAATAAPPTFGHPVMAGIAGRGFEPDLRVDPSNPNRIYMSAPGALSSDTSWIWRSLDAGKTFKWVPSATPYIGKAVACAGGGDTELAIDSAGHLYFNDLTVANFSTARSDDQAATFLCTNTAVPDTAVDRQWYALDGDPTNGGIIYLTNSVVGRGQPACPGAALVGNVLMMYRSPVAGSSATAGIQFGPGNPVSGIGNCNDAIMGNNEVSPVATTLGQPLPGGGFATLPAPVKHVYVIHDDAALHKILVGRCFPVAFGPPVPNVSDPSGLNCTDVLVADMGTGVRLGANFPTLAIDNAGNIYAAWSEAPGTSSTNITGDTVLKYTYSTDQGITWAPPMMIDTSGSPVGTLHTNVFPWLVAGDDGRVGLAWYGTPGAPTYPSRGPDSCTPAACSWSVWYVQSLNAHAASPAFTAPVQASQHFIHRGSVQTLIGGQNGDRTLGDFLQVRIGALGEAQISYADSNNINHSGVPHAMFVRQNGGEGLLNVSPVQISGLTPFNSVSDPTGDGRYEANSTVSANMPQLDILGSSVRLVTTAPCSDAAPCYEVVMQINNLSLAPTLTQDPDQDLVWHTQWLIPSQTNPQGGKNFFVYAESFNGSALQCFAGENAQNRIGGGVSITYPGATTLPAANCQSKLGPNGHITIYVPLTAVS